ncbi:MAG TPA: MFS transporter [Anaerolineales bacterium]
MNATYSPTNPMLRVMSLRNFRLLFAGAFISLLGDQFAIIATPWLVLQLTKDPVMLGTVLAVEGIPRAALILFGGAIADRLSPRRVMLIANIIRLFLTALMSVVVLRGVVQVWMIYVFGLLFGVVAGLAIPAETSIVPTLVADQDLQAGNSLVMGISQLAGFIGPTVAGIIIGRFSSTFTGVGIAFAFDAFTFVVSAVTLQLIQIKKPPVPAEAMRARESVWASIQAGISYLWTDRPLRFIFMILMAANFLLIGPILVGIPVLAHQRLPEGATAFGLLMSAFAGGNLLGYLVTGSLPRPDGAKLRLIMVAVFAGFGIVIGSLGVSTSTWIDFGLLFLVGLGNGFIAVLLVTWMQTRIPRQMLGRIMALLMLSSTGLVPISQAIAGVISKWSLTMLFVIPGILVLLSTAWMAFQPDLRNFSESLTAAQAERRERA